MFLHASVLIATASDRSAQTTFAPSPNETIVVAFPVRASRVRICADSQCCEGNVPIVYARRETCAHRHQCAYISSAAIEFLIPLVYIARHLLR